MVLERERISGKMMSSSLQFLHNSHTIRKNLNFLRILNGKTKEKSGNISSELFVITAFYKILPYII